MKNPTFKSLLVASSLAAASGCTDSSRTNTPQQAEATTVGSQWSAPEYAAFNAQEAGADSATESGGRDMVAIRGKIAKLTAEQICMETLKKPAESEKKPKKTPNCGERFCNETETDFKARIKKETEEKAAIDAKNLVEPTQEDFDEYVKENGIDCTATKNKLRAQATQANLNAKCKEECIDGFPGCMENCRARLPKGKRGMPRPRRRNPKPARGGSVDQPTG